jgi:hypothetical protein
LIRIARQVVSYLHARNEPDFASPHIPTVHHPHSQGDEYLAGMPRRAIMDVVHGWKIPSPSGKLPVDD